MALSPGTRIGPYDVAAQIGVGGMGEVYRARDSKLGRDVAIKVLPESVAQDADRLARFDREARTLAALNHQNIAQIYGLEEIPSTGSGQAAVKALVMELVEGPTLADRLAHGAIPPDEALPIAQQIAHALESAHELGIVHRDLKPANVKVRPDGVVKVLDFGLAKAIDAGRDFGPAGHAGAKAPAYVPLSQAPTITTPAMTQMGMVLGTAAYMSPEQARGKPVDKRTDIWAFGCVVYEMLTGTRAFAGEDVTGTLARVINAEPRLEALPVEWRTLVGACLEKNPHARLRDIGDVWRLRGSVTVGTVATKRSPIAWVTAAVLLVALAALGWMFVREDGVEQPPLHLSIALPGEGDEVRSLALSPDGRTVVMAASIGDKYQLWLRDLQSTEFRPLANTALARVPFWSPDGRSIGFFADQKLKVVAAAGGPPRALCDAGFGNGGTWNRDGVILVAPNGTGPIYRVGALGGDCSPLTVPEPGTAHVFPEFLDDGRHFFYVVTRGDESKRGVYVAALDDPSGRRVLADESSVVYVAPTNGDAFGFVLFLRDDTLMAQQFDPGRLQVTGEASALARPASRSNSVPQMAASASANGTLVYLTNSLTGRNLQLVWKDRAGRELETVGAPGNLAGVSLSPDGRNAAVAVRDRTGLSRDLWLQDLARGTLSRFTSETEDSQAPVWAPDGLKIIFGGLRTGTVYDLYLKDLGSIREELVLKSDRPKQPSDWSEDGRYVVYTELAPTTGADIWTLDLSQPTASRKGVPFARTPYMESQGQLSPDGKWMAYTSSESGDNEVYIRPFPSGDGAWRVSTSGGREPQWRRDGRELFYLEGVLSRMRTIAVPVSFTSQPLIGNPTILFEFRSGTGVPQVNWFVYAPAGDGQRFLVTRYADNVQPTIDVLTNWRQTLAAAQSK